MKKENPVRKFSDAAAFSLARGVNTASKLHRDAKFSNGASIKNNLSRQKIPTNALFDSFQKYCEAIRKIKPVFIRFKDGNLIKHALKHLSEFQIEMLFLWFLRGKRHMRPSIGAALSRGIISDFINASHREYGFYHKLEQLAKQYAGAERSDKELRNETDAMLKALQKLKNEFSRKIRPFSYRTRAKIAEEAATDERKLKR